MIKKLSIATLLLHSTLAHATGYIGLSMGVQVNTDEETSIMTEKTSYYRGMPLTIFGGYGIDVSGPFYIGGELFVIPTTARLSASSSNYLKTTSSIGASFIPGIQFNEHTRGYARLGIANSYFENQNTHDTGAQFGLGLQASLTPHWDVRSEWVVTSYSFQGRTDQFNVGVVYGLF